MCTGACGIAAGTPLAIVGGLGAAAQKGAIIRSGRTLEALSSVDTVVFDKTGTYVYAAHAYTRGRQDMYARVYVAHTHGMHCLVT